MGSDDAALLALASPKYQVKVSEPIESDTGEFGEPDQLDCVEFPSYIDALHFCQQTARRGLRAVLYRGIACIAEYE